MFPPPRNKREASLSKRLKKAQASIKTYTSNTYSFLYVNHTPISKGRKEGETRKKEEGGRGEHSKERGEDKEEGGRRKGEHSKEGAWKCLRP